MSRKTYTFKRGERVTRRSWQDSSEGVILGPVGNKCIAVLWDSGYRSSLHFKLIKKVSKK